MQFALTGLALFLAACSSESDGDMSTLFQIGRNIVDPQVTSVSLQQAAAISHASIGLRLGGGSEVLLVLAIFEPGQLWVAGKQLSVVTREGRIVQTQGLEHDLTKLNPADEAYSSLRDVALGRPARTKWIVDFEDLKIFSAPLACEAHAARRERILILGKPIETVRIDERCNSELLRWSFTNFYWVSPTTGQIWKSVQRIHPALDPVSIEVLRPAASR